ncbi:MAG: DUF2071 domain-containing protein [Verrucomicrobia bacterium]|nr:DUF2071 domain-containing protein [Verrucomicrobiota bacterium]
MNKVTGYELDRLAPRGRPPGSPVMEQTWSDLLFLHWPISTKFLRPLIPAPLEIDLFENHSWIGITPFTISNLRVEGLPQIPGLSSLYEINVRTYVHYRGMPGVWFFSLDASKLVPALAARLLYSLPYHKASIEFDASLNGTFRVASKRLDTLDAGLEVIWKEGINLRSPDVNSLAFFLAERYCLYSADQDHLYRARIYHAPWQLRDAESIGFRSTLFSAMGLPDPTTPPLLHCARKQNVEVWPSETLL